MGVGQLSESDAVDALRLPFYSSRYARGSNRRAITLIWGIPVESTGIRTVMGSSGVNRPPRGRRLGRGRHFWTFTLVRGVVTL